MTTTIAADCERGPHSETKIEDRIAKNGFVHITSMASFNWQFYIIIGWKQQVFSSFMHVLISFLNIHE